LFIKGHLEEGEEGYSGGRSNRSIPGGGKSAVLIFYWAKKPTSLGEKRGGDCFLVSREKREKIYIQDRGPTPPLLKIAKLGRKETATLPTSTRDEKLALPISRSLLSGGIF